MSETNESGNFKYLNELIESDDEIILDRDIILNDSEVEFYRNGIEITKDCLIIDCRNHIIDAKGKASIFNITSKNITLKNIIFKNGHNLELGGAINHNKGKMNIIHCKFINSTSENMGGALSCSFGSDITIKDTTFFKNHAPKGGCIFNKNGKIEIIDCKFLENTAGIDASAIINMMMGILTAENCIFKKNTSKNVGCILNFGRCNITGSIFERNNVENNGAAINNQTRSRLSVKDSKFIENEAGNEGGAIANFSDVKLDNVEFLKNHTKNQAGAISNQKDGLISITHSKFIQNSSDMTSGAILNWGRIDIDGAKFKSNSSNEIGGAILNGETGFLKIKKAKFKSNSCNYSGGAIANWRQIHLHESVFEDNSAELGGAILCAKKASTSITRTRFLNNSSKDGSAILNNSHNTKISKASFTNHTTDNMIHNYKSITLLDVNFENNEVKNIIINDENGRLSMFGGKFNGISRKSSIYNIGDFCSITKIKFESDKNITEIHNKGYMIINELKFNSKSKTLINEGVIDVKNMPDDSISRSIENRNKINNFSKRSKNRHDFSFLQDKINRKAKFKRPTIKLKNDISLEFYECDYFEGGIEIIADNLTIDGENHSIDGKHRSRIFIINARDVTIKNITLKNGQFTNHLDEYVLGGGAIHILRGSSLRIENVTLAGNKSTTCGGAILNEGITKSINSKFIDNSSDNYGGAIYNKNRFNTDSDEFCNNRARIAGAIYNQKCLEIENDIILDNNKSQFLEGIYNADITDADDRFRDLIFNTSRINMKKIESKSFTCLEEEIEKSDEIMLNQDIVFDYSEDRYLRYMIQISKDLTIDGNGHTIEFNPLDGEHLSIDGNNSSSLFKIIKESTNVTLKNIIFKNCYSNRQSIIENKGKLTIENCKFINNRITEDNCLIENRHHMEIIDTDFANNKSNRQSLIRNSSQLNIRNSNFINNNSQAIGCCITNKSKMKIKKSIFKSNATKNKAGAIHNEYDASLKLSDVKFKFNSADVDGGAIYNYGKLDIKGSLFANNTSEDDGGVINNRTSGEINIYDTKFIENESKSNGGVIYSYGNVEIDLCEFKCNRAKYRASVIEHVKALDNRKRNNLTISNSKFVKNLSDDRKEVVAFDNAYMKLLDCKFNLH